MCHGKVLLTLFNLFLWQCLAESLWVAATVVEIQADVKGRLTVDVGEERDL